MKIIIDAMSGDNAPQETVAGAVRAADELGVEIVFVGREAEVRACLGSRADAFPIVNADDIITMEDDPSTATRRKKNSSMAVALRILSEGEGDAMVSAGSTGALLTGATLTVGRIKGIRRAALAPVLPAGEHGVMLIDCGANVDCKAEYLEQFALMGSAYMADVLAIKNPRVGLINNGAEEGKGNELTKEAYQLLKVLPGINFVGNCEGREVMSGNYDVLVCDGFVGNAVLKSLEGTAEAILKMIKSELMSRKRSKFGAMFCRKSFRALKKKLDYTEYGGAAMLGINGGIIKAHGSSDARAICSAIEQARKLTLGRITERIASAIEAIPKREDEQA